MGQKSKILTLPNVLEALEESAEHYSAECSDIKAMAEECYRYLVPVKLNKRAFDEVEVMGIVTRYIQGPENAIRDAWAILVMFGFENMYWKMIGFQTDLMSECMNASYAAAKRFDFEQGVKLVTFLYKSVKDSLCRIAYENLIRLPAHAQSVRLKMCRIIEKNPAISDEDLAAEVDATVELVKNIRNVLRQIDSLETKSGTNNKKNDEADALSTFLKSDEDIEKEYAEKDLTETIRENLVPTIAECFSDRNAYVCKFRIGEMVGCPRLNFNEIRPKYARYLLICEELAKLGARNCNLTSECKRLSHVLTCDAADEAAFKAALARSDVSIVNAVRRAEERYSAAMCGGEQSQHFKTTSSVQQLFHSVFPSVKYTHKPGSDPMKERQNAFRFRLREMGLAQLADKLVH